MVNPFKYHLYHYVQPCPRCGSTETGYFVTGDINTWRVLRGLKNGELVHVRPQPQFANLNLENCFCAECGGTWRGDIKLQIIDDDTLDKYKKERKITKRDIKDFNQYLDVIEEEREQRKKDESRRDKKRKRSERTAKIMSLITGR